MMKLRNAMKKYGPAAGTAALCLVGGPVFAAEGDIDVTKALAYIAGGLVAAGALTAAMMGLVALIGAGKKTHRAGT